MAGTELRPQKGGQEIALSSKADVVIYGGAVASGKSYVALLRAGMDIADPNANAIIFRRNTAQLRDGLWKQAKTLFKAWKPRTQDMAMRFIFKNGAVLKFNHMQHVKDAEGDHQGLEYSLVIFDEATHFEEEQVTYLMSRLRSAAAGNSQMMLTCNPDPDSFLADWIEWWLDEEGYPDPAKKGVIRYYTTVDNQLKFADTEAELVEMYEEHLYVPNPITGGREYVPPKTMAFIGGTIFDNPIVIAQNPKYLGELNALPKLEKARLLHGNWKIRPEGASYFQRTWLKKAAHVPLNTVYCRAWDKASTEPSDVNRHPDYTASVKIHKDREGYFYIVGNYHNSNHDKKDPEVFGRFRERAGSRDQIIEAQTIHDGADCTVVFSQDPGSAGVTEFEESAKKLIQKGYTVRKDPMPPINSKLSRYTPFSSACENGLVYIVESTFNRPTLEAFYKEHEAFDGERSTRIRKDDIPDATASAFNWLCKKAVIPSFTLSEFKRDNPFGDR